MKTPESLKGRRFGSVVVIRDFVHGGKARRVTIRCDCGAESAVAALTLHEDRRCNAQGCTERRRELGVAS